MTPQQKKLLELLTPTQKELFETHDSIVRSHGTRIDSLEENYKIIVAAIHKRREWSLPEVLIYSQMPGVVVGAGIILLILYFG